MAAVSFDVPDGHECYAMIAPTQDFADLVAEMAEGKASFYVTGKYPEDAINSETPKEMANRQFREACERVINGRRTRLAIEGVAQATITDPTRTAAE